RQSIERGGERLGNPGSQMLPADVEMLPHGRKAMLVAEPADHGVADLVVKFDQPADQRIAIVWRDRREGELAQRVERLGEQLLLAAEDPQHGPGGGVRACGDRLDGHRLERVRDQEPARALQNALPCRRGGFGTRSHQIGSGDGRFHVIYSDTNMYFVSIPMTRNIAAARRACRRRFGKAAVAGVDLQALPRRRITQSAPLQALQTTSPTPNAPQTPSGATR